MDTFWKHQIIKSTLSTSYLSICLSSSYYLPIKINIESYIFIFLKNRMEERRPSKLIIAAIGQLGNGRIIIQIHSFLTPNSLFWKHCTFKSMTCTQTIIQCEGIHTKINKKEKEDDFANRLFCLRVDGQIFLNFLLRLFLNILVFSYSCSMK